MMTRLVAVGAAFLGLLVSSDGVQSTLVHKSDISYVGAFRVPTQADLNFDHSGRGLTFDPESGTLFVSNYAGRVSEITIPAPGTGTTVQSLPRASMVQGPTDVLRGRLAQAGDIIGGLLVDGPNLIVSAHWKYDASFIGRASHFRVARDFTKRTVTGPVQLVPQRSGTVGGPMARIPQPWQTLLGGPAVTGLCCVSIITRSSFGPTASVFDPADLTRSQVVLGYPPAHRTLGDWNSSGTLWNNGGGGMAGMVFIDGSNSVLYFGGYGVNYCYGTGEQCNDPTSPFQGDHAYPYDYHVWAYDADELVAVKTGRKQSWEVVPYAVWNFDMPFATGARTLRGVAYDPATRRIFLAEQKADGAAVVIRVLQVNAVLSTTPGDANGMIRNGNFSGGVDANGMPVGWSRHAGPTPADIVVNATGGTLGFQRPAGSTQAGVFQRTGVAVPAGTQLRATFEIGNTDPTPKSISVTIHDEDSSDLTTCTFGLEPTQPLRGYVMGALTTKDWSGATLSFFAQTTGTGGFYRLDNVTMRQVPESATADQQQTRRRPVDEAVCARGAIRRAP